MEGAAIALVAAVNRVPFVIIRSVSDHADVAAPADFGAYLRRAAANSYTVCAGILTGLAAGAGLSSPATNPRATRCIDYAVVASRRNAQPVKRRSSQANAAYMPMPSAASAQRPANTSGTSKLACAVSIM